MKYNPNETKLKSFSFVRCMKDYLRSQQLVLYGRKSELWERIQKYQVFPLPHKRLKRLLSIKRCIKDGLRGPSKVTSALRKNKRIILLAMRYDKEVFRKCDIRLQRDEEIIEVALETNGLNIRICPRWVRTRDDLVYKAVCNQGTSILYASKKYLTDPKYVLKAADTWGGVIRECPYSLRDDIGLA